MPVLNLKHQEFGTNHNKDSDIDDGEQSDHDMEQNSTVINDVVREVCIEDPEDIKSDIQTLSNTISDGVRERLCSLQSTISEPSTTQNQCGNYTKHSPFLKLRDNTFIRKTTAVWLLQEGERVSSDRLFRVRGKQPFSMEIEPTLSEKVTTGKDTPHISDKVEVGDMCAFKEKGNFQIGKVLQFCYYEEKGVRVSVPRYICPDKASRFRSIVYMVSRFKWAIHNV